jgi:MFS transporter, PAT family, beta-lactamase induction signal transducer AmpG
VPAFAALLDAVGAAPKFGGYAIFFAYTALLGLPALVLAVIVRRHFEKETPPSARKEGQ